MSCVLRHYANSAYICIANFRKTINDDSFVVTTPNGRRHSTFYCEFRFIIEYSSLRDFGGP